MTSDVFYELCKDHLQTAIQSDYLQVIVSSYSIIFIKCRIRLSYQWYGTEACRSQSFDHWRETEEEAKPCLNYYVQNGFFLFSYSGIYTHKLLAEVVIKESIRLCWHITQPKLLLESLIIAQKQLQIILSETLLDLILVLPFQRFIEIIQQSHN